MARVPIKIVQRKKVQKAQSTPSPKEVSTPMKRLKRPKRHLMVSRPKTTQCLPALMVVDRLKKTGPQFPPLVPLLVKLAYIALTWAKQDWAPPTPLLLVPLVLAPPPIRQRLPLVNLLTKMVTLPKKTKTKKREG